MAKIKLTKSVMIDGVEKKEIEYDIEALTGADATRITKELLAGGYIVGVKEADNKYHAAIFAASANITVEDVERMSLRDFEKVDSLVRDFLTPLSEEA